MKHFPDLTKPSHLFATFFGIGLLPFAPGTWGSLAGLLLFFCFIYFQLNFFLFLLLFLCFSIFSIVVCEIASKDLIEKDQRAIVIDEVAGLWLSLLFIPFLGIYNFSTSEWQNES